MNTNIAQLTALDRSSEVLKRAYEIIAAEESRKPLPSSAVSQLFTDTTEVYSQLQALRDDLDTPREVYEQAGLATQRVVAVSTVLARLMVSRVQRHYDVFHAALVQFHNTMAGLDGGS